MTNTQVFVGRERQLAQLDVFLNQALAGKGQVCFITGDAGAGKTTLVSEFARRAEARDQNLVTAVGLCDPQTGATDPYLLFRELLTMLTGDIEARLAQGAISQENAKRLQRAVRTSIESLVEFGPDLIGLLVPGANLVVHVAKIGIEASKKAGLMAKLQQAPASPRSEIPGSSRIDQSQIFEQYAKVLKALAQHAPLLLILDDLQWADNSSIDLLFHLVRRIESSRILIVGLYRPAEIALGRSGERHPLEKVLTELKRYHGDVFIDLDQVAREEGAAFIAAFLDTEPNQLGLEFRRAVCERTGGNPLFVVELLRAMQERGDILPDAQGRWVEGRSLDWSALPARAEGVIEERLSRLTADLLEALKLASVQGEAFTAEVVAQSGNLNVRDFVRQLSGELEKRHRLVTAQGQQRIGDQRLSQYQFQSRLFQQYLYAALNPTERAYLHEDIGRALEKLYGERADEIAVRLAWHFEEAGITDKARHYLRRAGEQAAARAANADAVSFFSRALALTPADDGPDEVRLAERYALLLARQKVYDLQAKREEQARDLAELEQLAEALGDPQKRAEVAVERAAYAEAISEYDASIAAAQAAVNWAQAAGDRKHEVAAHLRWGMALQRQSDYPGATAQAELSLAMAREVGLVNSQAISLRLLASIAADQGSVQASYDYSSQALPLFRELGDRRSEAKTLMVLGSACRDLGRYAEAKTILEQSLGLAREIGDRRSESAPLNSLGVVSMDVGDLAGARGYYEQVLAIARDGGEHLMEGVALVNLSGVCRGQTDYVQAEEYARASLLAFQDINVRRGEAYALTNLGHALRAAGRLAPAAQAYEQAVTIRRETNEHTPMLESLAGVANVRLAQEDAGGALAAMEEILVHLAAGKTLDGMEEPFAVYLTCYEVLRANGDARADNTLAAAYNLLQDHAAKIPSDDARRIFLANISAHREIIKAFTGAYPEVRAPQPAAGPAVSLTAAPVPPAPEAVAAEPGTPPQGAGPAASPQGPEQALPPLAPYGSEAAAPIVPPVAVEVAPAEPAADSQGSAGPEEHAAPARRMPIGAAVGAFLRRLARPWAARGRLLGLAGALLAVVVLLAALPRIAASLARGNCPPNCAGKHLSRQDWRDANLVGVDLSGADLYRARLAGADLTAAGVISATLAGADLYRANLLAAELMDANLVGANLIEANLVGADLREADLRGAALLGADLTSADLRGARLVGANLLGAKLNGADLRGADLRAADLRQTTDPPRRQAQYGQPALRAITQEMWSTLPLGNADLTGVLYDAETRWPIGVTAPPATD